MWTQKRDITPELNMHADVRDQISLRSDKLSQSAPYEAPELCMQSTAIDKCDNHHCQLT